MRAHLKHLLKVLFFCRISRSQCALCATSPSRWREARCPTLKWANTSTETADRTPLRERERSRSPWCVRRGRQSANNKSPFVFQIFTNRCSKGGCKQKEMMRVTCDQCHLNFCLKHRHPLDHDCKPDGKSLSKSGWVLPSPAGPSEGKNTRRHPIWSRFFFSRHAAAMRASASSSSASSSSSTGNPPPISNGMSRAHSSRLGRARSDTSGIKLAYQMDFSPLSSAPQRLPTSVSAQNVIPPSASFQAGMVRTSQL